MRDQRIDFDARPAIAHIIAIDIFSIDAIAAIAGLLDSFHFHFNRNHGFHRDDRGQAINCRRIRRQVIEAR